MNPPTPHTCSSSRPAANSGEKYESPADVLNEEPCLFAPFQPSQVMGTFMGPVDVSKYVLFIGYDADVKMGDVVTRDDTGETFVVSGPPVKFECPVTWQPDHQQVELMKQAIA